MAGEPGVPAPPKSPDVPLARRFTDREVAELIRRAIELQESSRSTAAAGDGFRIEDVRQIARDVGVDPRFVDLAVSGAGGAPDREGNALVGAPYGWRVNGTVDGEVPVDERGRILDAIRDVTKMKGDLEDVYGRMEWSGDDGLGPVIVGVESRDGVTMVDVTARRSGEVGLLYGLGMPLGTLVGGGIITAFLGLSGPAEVLPVMAGMGAVSFLGLRQVWTQMSRRWERKVGRIFDRVSQAGRAVARPPAAEEPRGDPVEGDDSK